jgi:hypothetical protein
LAFSTIGLSADTSPPGLNAQFVCPLTFTRLTGSVLATTTIGHLRVAIFAFGIVCSDPDPLLERE